MGGRQAIQAIGRGVQQVRCWQGSTHGREEQGMGDVVVDGPKDRVVGQDPTGAQGVGPHMSQHVGILRGVAHGEPIGQVVLEDHRQGRRHGCQRSRQA